MPFADGTFDAALTFHVAMNVADRDGFCRELARVLRPGAALCVFDVMKGSAQGMIYPVPWADTEATSTLKSRDETAALLEVAGFAITAEDYLPRFAMYFFRVGFATVGAAGGPPPLGLHLLTGANTREKFANLAKALETHQVEPVVLITKRS
jgi:SAM-dependent methyltransferase